MGIPGLDTPDFNQRRPEWVTRIRRRNHVDLRPWYDEGAAALRQSDVRKRLDDLRRSLADRLSRLRRIADAPGNLLAHNPRWVGRGEEMGRLHEAAGLGAFGVLTAVQGVGGMGKTALAIQYAYSYADFYPGGRWMIGCARQTSVAAAVRSLNSAVWALGSARKRKLTTCTATRVLSVLQDRAEKGAAARAGERHPPGPRACFILDNVDDPALSPAAPDRSVFRAEVAAHHRHHAASIQGRWASTPTGIAICPSMNCPRKMAWGSSRVTSRKNGLPAKPSAKLPARSSVFSAG